MAQGMAPGWHSAFHMDHIYMGLGSRQLVTTWIPLHDVTWETGGLAVLEGSSSLPGFARMRGTYGEWDTSLGEHSRHDAAELRAKYGDTSLTPGRNDIRGSGGGPPAGPISSDAAELLRYDGRARWLTTNYEQGDALLFTMKTLHGSVANTSTPCACTSFYL